MISGAPSRHLGWEKRPSSQCLHWNSVLLCIQETVSFAALRHPTFLARFWTSPRYWPVQTSAKGDNKCHLIIWTHFFYQLLSATVGSPQCPLLISSETEVVWNLMTFASGCHCHSLRPNTPAPKHTTYTVTKTPENGGLKPTYTRGQR